MHPIVFLHHSSSIRQTHPRTSFLDLRSLKVATLVVIPLTVTDINHLKRIGQEIRIHRRANSRLAS